MQRERATLGYLLLKALASPRGMNAWQVSAKARALRHFIILRPILNVNSDIDKLIYA